jgi:uncharacterized membrane protein HdeD (DUF308 family)
MAKLAQVAASGGKKLTVLGVIAIVLGVLAMLAPAVVGLSITRVLGVFVIGAGIARSVWAFQAGSLGKGLLTFALGTLTLLSGLVLFANPVVGSAMVTLVLTVYLVLDGIVEIGAGLAGGGIWLLLGGAVSILLGVMLWAQYPLSGAWAMGLLIGIKLFFVGVIMLTGGSALRAVASRF